MSPKLKTVAAYALSAAVAAGILAVVLYVVMSQRGEASNPGNDVSENVVVSNAAPGEPTPTPPPSDGAAAAPANPTPTPTPADAAADAPDNTLGPPDRIAMDINRLGRAPNAFSVSLYWSQVSGTIRYHVERDRGNGYELHGFIDGVQTSDQLREVNDPIRVKYRVRACADDAGMDCGLWGATAGVALEPLPAPTGLTAAAAHQQFGNTFSVDLAWNGLDIGRRYEIERDLGSGWARIGQVNHPASAYADRVVAPEAVTVQYRVSNCEDDACSPASETAAVTLTPIPAPPTPSLSGYYGAVGQEKENRQGTDLTWTAAGVGAEGGHFDLRGRPDDADWGHLRQIAWAAGAAAPTTYIHEIHAAETAFDMEYRIRACNPAGCSEWSNTVWVTVTTRAGGGN